MKVTVIGTLAKEGISSKTGKPVPWQIGEIYTLVSFSKRDMGASGQMGGVHKADFALVKKIEHLPTPFEAELDMQDLMMFGKQVTEVVDIRPIQRVSQVQKVA